MMRRLLYSKTMVLVVLLAGGLVLAGCGDTTPTAVQSNEDTMDQELSMLNTNQPVPLFDYSLQRDILIQIYRASNEIRNTYSYIVPYGNGGHPIFGCPSVGYPIMGGTQLTNPTRAVWQTGGSSSAYAGVAIGLMEPNGTYPPSQAEGTYFLCVRKNGDVVPEYAEDHVDTFSHPVVWDTKTGMFVDAGGASGVTLALKHAPAQEVTVAPTATPAP